MYGRKKPHTKKKKKPVKIEIEKEMRRSSKYSRNLRKFLKF